MYAYLNPQYLRLFNPRSFAPERFVIGTSAHHLTITTVTLRSLRFLVSTIIVVTF